MLSPLLLLSPSQLQSLLYTLTFPSPLLSFFAVSLFLYIRGHNVWMSSAQRLVIWKRWRAFLSDCRKILRYQHCINTLVFCHYYIGFCVMNDSPLYTLSRSFIFVRCIFILHETVCGSAWVSSRLHARFPFFWLSAPTVLSATHAQCTITCISLATASFD